MALAVLCTDKQSPSGQSQRCAAGCVQSPLSPVANGKLQSLDAAQREREGILAKSALLLRCDWRKSLHGRQPSLLLLGAAGVEDELARRVGGHQPHAEQTRTLGLRHTDRSARLGQVHALALHRERAGVRDLDGHCATFA